MQILIFSSSIGKNKKRFVLRSCNQSLGKCCHSTRISRNISSYRLQSSVHKEFHRLFQTQCQESQQKALLICLRPPRTTNQSIHIPQKDFYFTLSSSPPLSFLISQWCCSPFRNPPQSNSYFSPWWSLPQRQNPPPTPRFWTWSLRSLTLPIGWTPWPTLRAILPKRRSSFWPLATPPWITTNNRNKGLFRSIQSNPIESNRIHLCQSTMSGVGENGAKRLVARFDLIRFRAQARIRYNIQEPSSETRRPNHRKRAPTWTPHQSRDHSFSSLDATRGGGGEVLLHNITYIWTTDTAEQYKRKKRTSTTLLDGRERFG